MQRLAVRSIRSALAVVVFLTTTAAVMPTAMAHDADVYGPREKVAGKTLNQWAVEHLKWNAGSASAALNDPAGPACVPGRSGPMVLLPAALDSVATFECVVPSRLPVFVWGNGIWCWDEPDTAACATAAFDSLAPITTMTVDGERVERMQSRIVHTGNFVVDVEPASLLVNLGAIDPGPHPFGSAGFAAILEPMKHGRHSVVVHTAFNDGTSIDVTYNLTVN